MNCLQRRCIYITCERSVLSKPGLTNLLIVLLLSNAPPPPVRVFPLILNIFPPTFYLWRTVLPNIPQLIQLMCKLSATSHHNKKIDVSNASEGVYSENRRNGRLMKVRKANNRSALMTGIKQKHQRSLKSRRGVDSLKWMLPTMSSDVAVRAVRNCRPRRTRRRALSFSKRATAAPLLHSTSRVDFSGKWVSWRSLVPLSLCCSFPL